MSQGNHTLSNPDGQWSGHKQGRYVEFANGEIDRGDETKIDLHSFLTGHSKNIILMRVHSNAMRTSGLHRDGFMLVDRMRRPRRGDVVVVLFNGQRVVRRLEKREGRWALVPDDAHTGTFYITNHDRVVRIGVVIKAIIELAGRTPVRQLPLG